MPSRLAAIVMSWIWSRPWWAESSDSERVSVHLTGLPSLTDAARTRISSGVTCSLPPNPPPTSGAITRSLCSGTPVVGGGQRLEDVRDLRRRPHGQLLAGRVDDHGAGLHERRDQPLLAEPPPDDDRIRVVLRRGDRVAGAPARAGLAGVEHPVRAGIGAQVRVQQCGALGERLLHVEHRRQVVVVDDDELGGVARGGGVTGDHDCDPVTGEVHGVDGQRRRLRGLLVRRDRPGVGQARLGQPEVGRGVDGDDAGQLPGPRRRRCR